MKKVIVIGCPGSGKSTFSVALKEKTALPLYHLDLLYWNQDKTKVPRALFLARLSSVLEADRWIIDGNYASTMEARLQACDTVFFLDYPTEVCLDGVAQRKGKPRADLPWLDTENDVSFLECVKNYREESRPAVLELLKKYSQKQIYVFTCRAEASDFLKQQRNDI